MSQGRTPSWASSTILLLTLSGRGRPLTKTPPSWLTPVWPGGVKNQTIAFCLCFKPVWPGGVRNQTIAFRLRHSWLTPVRPGPGGVRNQTIVFRLCLCLCVLIYSKYINQVTPSVLFYRLSIDHLLLSHSLFVFCVEKCIRFEKNELNRIYTIWLMYVFKNYFINWSGSSSFQLKLYYPDPDFYACILL